MVNYKNPRAKNKNQRNLPQSKDFNLQLVNNKILTNQLKKNQLKKIKYFSG